MTLNRLQIFLVCMAICFHSCASSSLNVDKYRVDIAPNIENKSIVGATEITFSKAVSQRIRFPVYGLQVSSVTSERGPCPFEQNDNELWVDLSRAKDVSSIKINYQGRPTKGLVWGPNYVYTSYDPCTWMFCFEDPSYRVPVQIHVTADSKFKTVTTSDDQAYSSYLYGFAVGDFTSVTERSSDLELEYLGINQSTSELEKKFKITKDVIRFFEEKSGVRFPKKKYIQLLVPGGEAQEKNGLSILGTDVVDPIVKNPKEDWAIVHELAHQWWGNLLTCKSWDHFWLNEGVTVFMTAAYKQEKWGQAEYDREMNLARKRHQRAIEANFDVPLTFNGVYPSMAIKRAIVYSKAALFLDALRKKLGDEVFWTGIQNYTIHNQFMSVDSKIFQTAMQKAHGQSLDDIFNKWVY